MLEIPSTGLLLSLTGQQKTRRFATPGLVLWLKTESFLRFRR